MAFSFILATLDSVLYSVAAHALRIASVSLWFFSILYATRGFLLYIARLEAGFNASFPLH